MSVLLHPHAENRLAERGGTVSEVIDTVVSGERFPAKFNRTGFRKNLNFDSLWNEKHHTNKQIEAYCVEENSSWLVITIIVKYF